MDRNQSAVFLHLNTDGSYQSLDTYRRHGSVKSLDFRQIPVIIACQHEEDAGISDTYACWPLILSVYEQRTTFGID